MGTPTIRRGEWPTAPRCASPCRRGAVIDSLNSRARERFHSALSGIAAGGGHRTGVSGGFPARTAAALSRARMPIVSRVASPALAVCGVSTSPGASSSAGLTWGSPSNTSSAAPRIWPVRSASIRAASSTTPPRAVLIRYAVGFHRAQGRGVDQVAGLGGQRGVHGDDVAVGEQGRGVDEGDTVLDGAGFPIRRWRRRSCRRPGRAGRRPARSGRSRGCRAWRRR